ncbi:MAG: hypothetical protein IJL47_06085 [Lachnospiraceae bacterium]|nr:hypothetical protein [Lachnospiraceae bacterium]
MEQKEFLQHWNYFCSLTVLLEGTKDFVYHGLDIDTNVAPHLVHGNVYSDRFKQIILLSASEFEIISKSLCKECGETVSNIVDISRAILQHFPRIVQAEVITQFCVGTPMCEWRVDSSNKVIGLDWWRAYTALKHNEVDSYRMATLENAVLSLACLYIVELYLMYKLFGSLALAYNYPAVYFRSKYTAYSINSGDGSLPDYGDQTPFEKATEKYSFLLNDNI